MQREALYVADLIENARAVQKYLDGVSRGRWDSDQMQCHLPYASQCEHQAPVPLCSPQPRVPAPRRA